jgi:hypothetical protein
MRSLVVAALLLIIPTAARADDGGAEAGAEAATPGCKDGVYTNGSGDSFSCAPFACATTGCKSKCASNADCASNATCEFTTQKCLPHAVCSTDGTTSIGADGTPSSCEPYRCQDGLCLAACASDADCTNGAKCDATKKSCEVPNAAASPYVSDDSSGSCAMGGRGPSAFGLALFVAALVSRTARTARTSRAVRTR